MCFDTDSHVTESSEVRESLFLLFAFSFITVSANVVPFLPTCSVHSPYGARIPHIRALPHLLIGCTAGDRPLREYELVM